MRKLDTILMVGSKLLALAILIMFALMFLKVIIDIYTQGSMSCVSGH